MSRRLRQRKGFGYLIQGAGGLFWSVGSLVNPDATVLLIYLALPVWVTGLAIEVSTLPTSRTGTSPPAVADRSGGLTLRRSLLWLAIANVALATAVLVLDFAFLPHGMFKLWTVFFWVSAALNDWVALAGYGFVFRWHAPFRRVQTSFFFCGFTALMSAYLVFIAVAASRTRPEQALRSQESILVLIILATFGSLAWAALMYVQMRRDGGVKEINHPGAVRIG